MTNPPFFPALPGQGWSARKKPTFATLVASHVSGREVRDALYVNPIWQFELTFDGLASDATSYPGLGAQSLQALMGLFLQCQGQWGTFLYVDPSDNAVSGQALGVGDGTTTTFTLARSLGGFLEPVGWVTNVSQVSVGGAAESSGWSLERAQQPRLCDAAGERRGDRRQLRLRLPLPLRRRRGRIRAGDAEPMATRKPQIPFGARIMKTASPALIAFLNAARANPDAPIAFAECFTFTLATGTVLA